MRANSAQCFHVSVADLVLNTLRHKIMLCESLIYFPVVTFPIWWKDKFFFFFNFKGKTTEKLAYSFRKNDCSMDFGENRAYPSISRALYLRYAQKRWCVANHVSSLLVELCWTNYLTTSTAFYRAYLKQRTSENNCENSTITSSDMISILVAWMEVMVVFLLLMLYP